MATETKKPKAAKAPKAAGTKRVKTPSSKPVAQDGANALQRRRTLVGLVVSNKMQKTIVVKIERSVRHGKYSKYVAQTNRFKAHDEKNDAKIGDRVLVVESRPLSRDKRWVLKEILRRAAGAPEANA